MGSIELVREKNADSREAAGTVEAPRVHVSSAELADALAFGLTWRVGKGDKESNAAGRFACRIDRFAPELFVAWSNACRGGRSFGLSKAVEQFINRISSYDTVDADMPLYRAQQPNSKNSFTFVRILKSLVTFFAGRDAPELLLDLIAAAESRSANFLFYAAHAQLLLDQGELRKAADSALHARSMRAYDLCVTKTVFATQKALFDHGMAIDVNYDFSDDAQRFCSLPFTVLNIHSRHSRTESGDLSFGMCKCRGWMPIVFDFDDDSSWNGKDARELRQTMLDGSFKYCDKLRCPYLRNRHLPKPEEVEDPFLRQVIDDCLTELPRGPNKLILAYDRSCNMSCPSCRDDLYMASPETVKSLDEKMDKVVKSLLPDVKILQLDQLGEALASVHYRRMFKTLSPSKYPELKISLMTNTKLLSEKTWQKLGPAADCIDVLILSIDGATPPTLEKLRRGLTWGRMIEALEFARGLRKSGKISRIETMFVLQKDNFREVPGMIEMCSRFLIDQLYVFSINAHGSYSNEEFLDLNVNNPKHALNPELQMVKGEVEKLLDQMRSDEAEIVAAGRTVPNVTW